MLSYPLTYKKLLAEFSNLSLAKSDITLEKTSKKWQEAYISKEFSLRKIRKFLKEAGFRATGSKEALCFVNEDKTVGVVLQGTQVHLEKNLFTRFCLEIQARKSVKVEPPAALVVL